MKDVDYEAAFLAQLAELWADVVDQVDKQLTAALDEAIRKVCER